MSDILNMCSCTSCVIFEMRWPTYWLKCPLKSVAFPDSPRINSRKLHNGIVTVSEAPGKMLITWHSCLALFQFSLERLTNIFLFCHMSYLVIVLGVIHWEIFLCELCEFSMQMNETGFFNGWPIEIQRCQFRFQYILWGIFSWRRTSWVRWHLSPCLRNTPAADIVQLRKKKKF